MTKYMKKGGASLSQEVFEGIGQLFINIFNYIFNNVYLLAVFFISIIGLIIYLIYHYDPFKILENHYYTVLVSMGIFITILASIFLFIVNYKSYIYKGSFVNYFSDKGENENANTDFKNFLLKAFTSFSIVVGVIGFIFGIYWLILNVKNPQILSTIALVVLSVIIFLGVVYLLLEHLIDPSPGQNTENKHSNLFKFIKELIFYVPCMLIEYIEYFEHQFGMTTKPVWILLILELLVIIAYFLLPLLSKNIILHEGIVIQEEPVYTNVLNTLATYQNLKLSNNIDFNYNYGLSFYLYINPQPPSSSAAYTTYTSLLNYANKPNIEYNAEENSLRVICQDASNNIQTVYETNNIQYQKWMHFVINYSSGIMDVFQDSKLVATKDQLTPYMRMKMDIVTSGSKNGINGGIKKVIYFKQPLTKTQIQLLAYE